MDTSTAPKISLYLPRISREQIYKAILLAGNTAKAVDEIISTILNPAWPLMEPFITTVCIKFLNTGYNLSSFCHVILMIFTEI